MGRRRKKYKQRCMVCKDNMVLIKSKRQKPICMDCQMRYVDMDVEDEEYKELFDIPRELYEKSRFLRDIKKNYHRFKKLSDKQVEVFKRVAKEMQEKLEKGELDDDKKEEE